MQRVGTNSVYVHVLSTSVTTLHCSTCAKVAEWLLLLWWETGFNGMLKDLCSQ